MNKVRWDLMWESAKEPLRWFVLMVLAYVVSLLLEVVPGISNFLYEYLGLSMATSTYIITAVLRAADKYVYKLQKERKTINAVEIKRPGLLGF